MWGIAAGLLGKLGIQGSLMIAAVAGAGYMWWMWDIEKLKVIELNTEIGKMEVIQATTLAAIVAMEVQNEHKDELHQESMMHIETELGERDERITELQEQNKFLFDKAVKKPFETGDAINARYREWMCKLSSRKDCASTTDDREDALPPASVGNAETDINRDDNSNNGHL